MQVFLPLAITATKVLEISLHIEPESKLSELNLYGDQDNS